MTDEKIILTAADFNERGFAIKSGSIVVHNFSRHDNSYTGSAEVSVTESVSIPALATLLAPPLEPLEENTCYVFQEGVWTVSPDYRGSPVYLKSTGEETFVSIAGELPEEVTLIAKPSAHHVWRVDQWEVDINILAKEGFEEATNTISVLNDKIELEDYVEDETEESVKAQLTTWKRFRISCKNVLDGKATELLEHP